MRAVAYQKRNSSGQGWLALCLVIGVFIVLPLGLLGFDLTRYYFASQQMRSAVDAAALAGVATLASSDNSNPQYAHESAARDAWHTFMMNSVFGRPFDTAQDPVTASHINATKPSTMPFDQAEIYIDFLKTDGSQAPLTDVEGKVMRVFGYYGYRAVFGTYLGFPDIMLTASSDGAVPQLDLEICFDVSGSMDDTTTVFLVDRMWLGDYFGIPSISRHLYHWQKAANNIYALCGPPSTGTRVNCLPPQNLKVTGSGSYATQWWFSEKNWGTHSSISPGLRCKPADPSEVGAPPGNYDITNEDDNFGNSIYGGFFTSGNTWDPDAALYSDMVVDISGNSGAYQSTTVEYPVGSGTTYNFPSVASLVEASRGNLDSPALYASSLANRTYGAAMPAAIDAGHPNYRAAYFWAAENLKTSNNTGTDKLYAPIGWSRDSAQKFCDLMKTNTDVHFGFTAFADEAGTAGDGNPGYWPPSGPDPFSNIDGAPSAEPVYNPSYLKGGSSTFPIPKVTLNQSSDNYTTVIAAIQSLRPTGSTNIKSSLSTALDDLEDNSLYRRGSRKAVILFTDGVPNKPSGTAISDALAQADRAHTDRIPIFTIGLATNPAIIPAENSLLNDDSGGIADRSDDTAKYFLVTSSTSLNDAFRVIARQLVQLTVNR